METVEVEHRLEQVRLLALVNGWREVEHSEKDSLISFRRKGVRLNIWYNRMTVSTVLAHPKLGSTQLFRKRVSDDLLEEIFYNPRVHTASGYMTKKTSNKDRWRV